LIGLQFSTASLDLTTPGQRQCRKHATNFRKIETLSPVDQVGTISAHATIRMIVGDRDDVAGPDLSKEYETAVRKTGKHAKGDIKTGPRNTPKIRNIPKPNVIHL
jgi:hypothetical protein